MSMNKPPRICSCGLIVAHGARCVCQITATRERNRRHDARRPSARERGYNHRWERERAAYLAAHPACRRCGNPATIVHHIIPHRGDRSLFWNRSNWMPACQPCHDGPIQRQERARRQRA